MPEEMYDAFVDDYGFNYEDSIMNAIDCDANGGGEPDLLQIPSFDEEPSLPPCFVNFTVSVTDFAGTEQEEEEDFFGIGIFDHIDELQED